MVAKKKTEHLPTSTAAPLPPTRKAAKKTAAKKAPAGGRGVVKKAVAKAEPVRAVPVEKPQRAEPTLADLRRRLSLAESFLRRAVEVIEAQDDAPREFSGWASEIAEMANRCNAIDAAVPKYMTPKIEDRPKGRKP